MNFGTNSAKGSPPTSAQADRIRNLVGAASLFAVPKIKLTVPGGGLLSIVLTGTDLAGGGFEFGEIPELSYAGVDEIGMRFFSSNGSLEPAATGEWFAAGTLNGVSYIMVRRDNVLVAQWDGTSTDDVTPLDAAGWTLVIGNGSPSLAAGDLSEEVTAYLDHFPAGTDPETQWNISIPARDATLPWWWGSTTDASPLHFTVFAENGRWQVLEHGSGTLKGHPDDTPAATTAPWAAPFSMVMVDDAFEPIGDHDETGGAAEVHVVTVAAPVTADDVVGAIADMDADQQVEVRAGIGISSTGEMLVSAKDMLEARAGMEMLSVGRKPRTHIVITDDDVQTEVMTHLVPLLRGDLTALAALGVNTSGLNYQPVPATLAVVTTTLDAGNELTWNQARMLRDTYGWEMATHGNYHRRPELEGENQTTTSTTWGSWEESTVDWDTCIERMRAEGFDPETHIYLFNAQDHRFHEFLKARGIKAAVGSNVANQYRNVLPLASWSIVRYDMAASSDTANDIGGSAIGPNLTVMDTLQEWKDCIDRAISDPIGDVFVFGLHSWKWTRNGAGNNTVLMQTMADLIQWVQAKPEYAAGTVVFSTVAQMMADCGNIVEAGVQKNQLTPTGPKQYQLSGSIAVSKSGAVRFPNTGVAVDGSPQSVTASTPATSFPLGKVSWVSQDASHGGSGWPSWNSSPTTEGSIMTDCTSHLPNCWFQEFYPRSNGDLIVGRTPVFARRNWISISGVWQWGAWMWFTGNVGTRLIVSATWTPGSDVTISPSTGYKTASISLTGASPTSHRIVVSPSAAWTEAAGGIPVGLDWGRGYIESTFNAGRLLFWNLNPAGGADVILKSGRGWRVNVFETVPIL